MKISTLSSAAIIAALTLGTLAPMAVEAAPQDLDSTGTVTVEEGGTEEIPGTVDPEDPKEELDPENPEEEATNPDLGPLMIEKVANLNFGTIATSANAISKTAAAIGTDQGDRGPYVQWRDIRAGGTYGYEIQAKMSEQFTSGANILTGATINYTNGFVARQGDDQTSLPTTTGGVELTAAGAAQTVVTGTGNSSSKGRYVMAFGNSENGTEANSVALNVPAATAANMALGDYTAKVTWSIVAAP